MKIFIYKFIIILFGVFLLFEFTIGSKIKYVERNFMTLFSKTEITTITEKVKESLTSPVGGSNADMK